MTGAVQIKPSPDGVPGAVSDPARVRAEDLTFAGADGDRINGYLAEPATEAEPRPAIVVVHEAGGLGEHIKDVANRFANLGYLALGVDLYTREGGPPPMDDPQALMARLFSIPDARTLADLEGGADFLRARDDASGKVGCIGFCMGGRYTLLLACSSERVDAVVDCWGGLIDAATAEQRSTPERPTPPLELVGSLHCPLYAAFGADDHNPSPQVGERLREALAHTPYQTTVDFYDGAGHAFFADYRPSYRPQPAALLWQRVVPFLAKHLQPA
jgi:carboxymethylenebutenolidase